MTSSYPSADRVWLAQQYVLGELSDDEAARFEETLADDPAACTAVADAARLVLSLEALAPTPTVVAAPVAARDRRLVVAVAMAACVLLMVLAWRPQSDPESTRQVRAEIIEARELVDRWRGGRAYAGPLIPGDDEDAEVVEGGDAVPSWMLAAVSIDKKPVGHSSEDEEVWEDN
uniref:Zinc-finger domain-containing protein n=1 Tax=Schlesneria paludicola TaxID=360056 RepID=A0A7C2P096_9PLAN